MDVLIQECGIPYEILRSKLPSIFEKSAHSWYTERACEIPIPQYWDDSKIAITTRFESDAWKREMKHRLNKLFYSGLDQPLAWLEKYSKLAKAIYPSIWDEDLRQDLILKLEPQFALALRTSVGNQILLMSSFGRIFEDIAYTTYKGLRSDHKDFKLSGDRSFQKRNDSGNNSYPRNNTYAPQSELKVTQSGNDGEKSKFTIIVLVARSTS